MGPKSKRVTRSSPLQITQVTPPALLQPIIPSAQRSIAESMQDAQSPLSNLPETMESRNVDDPKRKGLATKTIKIKPFSGQTPSGAIDPGTERWLRAFNREMEVAQCINFQKWTDQQKKSVLLLNLTDQARNWVLDLEDKFDQLNYNELTDALRHEFSSKLSADQITIKINMERKIPTETYREFGDRLIAMTEALQGGSAIQSNVELALGSLIKNAWPKYKDILLSQVTRNSQDPRAEMNHAIEMLTRFAGSDGAISKRKLSHPEITNARPNKHIKFHHANAVSVERKVKPKFNKQQVRFNNSNLKCWQCGKPGHTKYNCRQNPNTNSNTNQE